MSRTRTTQQTRSTARHPDVARRYTQIATDRVWGIVLIAILLAVAVHLGAFDWYTGNDLILADGTTQRLPDTFASIDHPFHISKERAVLDALRDGDFPQWIANHQGGYPAEFYPLGADIVVAAVWALGLGAVPLEVVHKLVVIAVLFIPAAGYLAISRRDNLPAGVAVIATLLHLFIPGSWMAGGPDELLRMGMWPNVAATYLMLPLLLFATDYLRFGTLRHLALAVSAGTLAIYTNPRATVAIATVLLAVVIVAVKDRLAWDRHLSYRLVSIVGLIGLLSSAVLIPLRAHQHEYQFTRFVEFDEFHKFREYLGGAMPWEIVALGLFGMLLAWRCSGHYSRVLALWFPLALGVILIAGWGLRNLSMFAQLEGPRLIPILRLPLLLLAALAIHHLVSLLVETITRRQSAWFSGTIAVLATALFVLTPISSLSASERGLPAIQTTEQSAFAAIAASAETYERIGTPEDRALVIGSPLSDHASFWVPALTGANTFHAAWIWYWKTAAYADRTHIADINAALSLDFLRRHGLTFVLIATNDTERLTAAASLAHLEPFDQASADGYSIFRVTADDPATNGPVTVRNGEVISVEVARETLRASVQAAQPTEVRIAINDFPAWSATVNESDTPIRRDSDGYILLDVPAGASDIELTYSIEPVVWVGRILTVTGVLLLVGVVVFRSRRSRAIGGRRPPLS